MSLSYNPLLDESIKPTHTHKEKISFLFALFIKKDITFNNQEFKRELVAANRLIKKYPEFDFFFSLTDITNKFNSLLGLTGKRMEIELSAKYEEYVTSHKRLNEY